MKYLSLHRNRDLISRTRIKNVFFMDSDEVACEYWSGISVPRQGSCRRPGAKPEPAAAPTRSFDRAATATAIVPSRQTSFMTATAMSAKMMGRVQKFAKCSKICEVDAASKQCLPAIALSRTHS